MWRWHSSRWCGYSRGNNYLIVYNYLITISAFFVRDLSERHIQKTRDCARLHLHCLWSSIAHQAEVQFESSLNCPSSWSWTAPSFEVKLPTKKNWMVNWVVVQWPKVEFQLHSVLKAEIQSPTMLKLDHQLIWSSIAYQLKVAWPTMIRFNCPPNWSSIWICWAEPT
jgi:hypothetical protein